MTEPKGWWLACPYYEHGAHILKLDGRAAYPERGPRVYSGGFLGPDWTKFHDPAGLVDRLLSRLIDGAPFGLTWQTGPSRQTLAAEFLARGFDCLEDTEIEPGLAFQMWRTRVDATNAGEYRPWRRPQKGCLVIRFGAYGDHLMAASVLPHLKDEGWHITYCAPPTGIEVLRHDPHIDAFLPYHRGLVSEDQRLVDFMETWGARFDRFVSLNAAIERALLYRPNQNEYYRDDETRRRLCAYNYLEYMHHVAGVPFEPRQRFYPSAAEAASAATLARAGGPLVVMAIAGSAEHKVWPHAPQGAVRLLAETDCRLAIAGGEKDIELAQELRQRIGLWLGPTALEERVIDLTHGGIRDTMAIACAAELVIGPETGVLNACAFEPAVGKVVLLSHSSVLNLTRDWPRTISLAGDVPCYPCHRLHETLRHCPRGPVTKRAACQEAISPELVVEAAKDLLAEPKAPRVVPLRVQAE